MNLLEWSEIFEDLGFNCFPLRHQSKEPAVASWKAYQTEKYEDGFKEGQNIAIICGVISKLIVYRSRSQGSSQYRIYKMGRTLTPYACRSNQQGIPYLL